MEGLNVNPLVSYAVKSNNNVNSSNVKEEFLELLCFEMADKMLGKGFLPENNINRDLAVKIFAGELAKQVKESEVGLK